MSEVAGSLERKVTGTEIREWIKPREIHFLNALQAYGDSISEGRKGVGYKYNDITFEKFVGAGLCNVASWMLLYGVKNKFGSSVKGYQVAATVETKNIDPNDLRIKSRYMSQKQKFQLLDMHGRD